MEARLTVEQAATRMKIPQQALRMGLRAGRFPFGTAWPNPGGRWSYYINAVRFDVYMDGGDMVAFVRRGGRSA